MMNQMIDPQMMLNMLSRQTLLMAYLRYMQQQQPQQLIPPAPYSPISNSSSSFIESPIKSEYSYIQEEPLNLCIRDQKLNKTKRYRGPRNCLTHKKSKTFQCNQCKGDFYSLSDLSDHTRQIHGGYRCHICKTDFTQRSNLQRHCLRHVGFKPYQCGVCKKEYYRKDHLIRHIQHHHPNVIPKNVIIQLLSSSESLSYIENTMSMVPNDVKSEETFPISESDNSSYDEHITLKIPEASLSNVFLSSTDSVDIEN